MISPRSSAAALVLALCSLCAQADEKQQRLQSDLFQACSQGSLEQVQKLLSEGASASLLAEDYGMLPLHEAIQHAHYEVVRLLVRHGAPLNNPSALARAAGGIAGGGMLPYSEFHTKKMVELLLSLGADVHAADDEPVAAAAGTALTVVQQLVQAGGRPTRKALVNAVTSCQLDIAEYLVQAGVDPLMTDSDGRTLLHEAAADSYWRDFGGSKPKEHLAMWNRLLMLGISINTRDRIGRSPLFEAVTEEMTAWMLQQKADVNLKDDKGMTALMAAAGAEDGRFAGILRLLIEAGADVMARDYAGHTALDHAARRESWEVMAVLLEAGAAPDAGGELLKSLAHASLDHPTPQDLLTRIAGRLLPHVRELNTVEVNGLPLLSWAVLINSQTTARLLLKAGANVEAHDSEGRTPLMLAAMTGNDAMSSLLLKAGADSGRKNKQGKTVENLGAGLQASVYPPSDSDSSSLPEPAADPNDIFTAVAHNQLEEAKRLVAGDPSLLTQKRGGIQPLHLAFSLGHREMVEALIAAGSSLDAKTSDPSSCLAVAAMAGRMELMRWLLQRADIFERDSMMSELRALWSVEGNYFSFKLALESGWKPEKHEDAQKALRLAVQHDDLPTLRTLLRFGASLSPVRETKDDPFLFHGTRDPNLLLLASEHRSPKLLGFLLDEIAAHLAEWRADVTEALLAAVKSGRVEVVRLLAERGGAELEAKGTEERTALHEAASRGLTEITDFLISKGARQDAKDKMGRTPAQLAESEGWPFP